MEFDEQALILRSQQGDKQAFGYLVKKYMQRAYHIALGLTSSHDNALDLSQDAFVRAYRAISKLNPQRQFFTWYYQILRNLCFNHLRDRARHATSFSEIGADVVDNIKDTDADSATKIEQAEMREILWKALESLKPQDREIIILKDFQELSYKEIAEILACPNGTVMSRLYHARKALKIRMEGYYHES